MHIWIFELDSSLTTGMTTELNLERTEDMVWVCIVQQGGESVEEALADEIAEMDQFTTACSSSKHTEMGEEETFAV